MMFALFVGKELKMQYDLWHPQQINLFKYKGVQVLMVWTVTTADNDSEILTSSIEPNVDQILQNLTQQVIALPLTTPPGGGGYSTDAWVGRCSPSIQTLTLFKTQFSDFPIPFKTEFKIFRPYLRHLPQNDTLFRIRMK